MHPNWRYPPRRPAIRTALRGSAVAGVLLEPLRESLLVSLLVSLRFLDAGSLGRRRIRKSGGGGLYGTRHFRRKRRLHGPGRPHGLRCSRELNEPTARGSSRNLRLQRLPKLPETSRPYAPSRNPRPPETSQPWALPLTQMFPGTSRAYLPRVFPEPVASEAADAFAASCVSEDSDAAGALVNFSDFGAPEAFRPLRILWWGLQMP